MRYHHVRQPQELLTGSWCTGPNPSLMYSEMR